VRSCDLRRVAAAVIANYKSKMKSTLTEKIKTWKYKTLGISMDGGTLSIVFTNPTDDSKVITLGQHMIAEYYEGLNGLPARIYIDGQIIEKRSEAEYTLIQFLEKKVLEELAINEKELLTEKLAFIKSDAYLNFIPVKLELSEKRKNYLNSTNTESSI